jgi:hypothetical protein
MIMSDDLAAFAATVQAEDKPRLGRRQRPGAPDLSSRRSAARFRHPLLLGLPPAAETDALPGDIPPDLPIRSISIQFSTSRYLRFRFRALTASRAVTSTRAHRATRATPHLSGRNQKLRAMPTAAFCSSVPRV